MKNLNEYLAIVSGLLAIILAILRIVELIWKEGRLLNIPKKLLSNPKIAWWIVVVLLLAFSLYLSPVNLFPPKNFPVEKGSVSAYQYEDGKGWSYLAVTSTSVNERLSTRYALDYGLFEEGEGSAGFDLIFVNPQDLSAYNFVEFSVKFGDDEAAFLFCIDDSSGKTDCVKLGDGSIAAATERGTQLVSLPISDYFPSVGRKIVEELTFDAIVSQDQDDHSFTVSNIQFRK